MSRVGRRDNLTDPHYILLENNTTWLSNVTRHFATCLGGGGEWAGLRAHHATSQVQLPEVTCLAVADSFLIYKSPNSFCISWLVAMHVFNLYHNHTHSTIRVWHWDIGIWLLWSWELYVNGSIGQGGKFNWSAAMVLSISHSSILQDIAFRKDNINYATYHSCYVQLTRKYVMPLFRSSRSGRVLFLALQL